MFGRYFFANLRLALFQRFATSDFKSLFCKAKIAVVTVIHILIE